jgi:hypothetical protein
VVYRTCLENKSLARDREFESHLLRRNVVRLLKAPSASTTDNIYRVEVAVGLELMPADDDDARLGIKYVLDEISSRFVARAHEILVGV